MQRTIMGTIHNLESESDVLQLMRNFSSARRFAFKRAREGRCLNDIRALTRSGFPTLNERWMKDAVAEGIQLQKRFPDQKILFGSKSRWQDLTSKRIDVEEWRLERDSNISSRGDVSHSGNSNLRIQRTISGFKVRIALGERIFTSADLWLPEKHRDGLIAHLASSPCYAVRIIRERVSKGIQWRCCITFEEEMPEPSHLLSGGCIGVDINPNNLAVVRLSRDGNVLWSQTIENHRLSHSRSGKREHDIWEMAHQVVGIAVENDCGLVIEDLKFKPERISGSKNRKQRRIFSNFVWKKMLTAIEMLAVRNGVEVEKVNPFLTSFIGRLKWMDHETAHEAAAIVIGRRGLGFSERIPEWLEKLIGETLQEEADDVSGLQLWRKLHQRLTAPGRRAKGVQRTPICRVTRRSHPPPGPNLPLLGHRECPVI